MIHQKDTDNAHVNDTVETCDDTDTQDTNGADNNDTLDTSDDTDTQGTDDADDNVDGKAGRVTGRVALPTGPASKLFRVFVCERYDHSHMQWESKKNH